MKHLTLDSALEIECRCGGEAIIERTSIGWEQVEVDLLHTRLHEADPVRLPNICWQYENDPAQGYNDDYLFSINLLT